jgi:hypothetical protein
MDIYYLIDAKKQEIERMELSSDGVISVRAGVTLLRENQLAELAIMLGVDPDQAVNALQNPGGNYKYIDGIQVEQSGMIVDYVDSVEGVPSFDSDQQAHHRKDRLCIPLTMALLGLIPERRRP